MNFFDLLALAVWIGVIASGVLLLRGLRQSRPVGLGPAPRLHDLSEAAFMAGGPGAVVDAALVSLLCDGRMLVGGPGIVQVRPGVRGGDPAQRAVLQACQGAPSGWLYQIRYAAMRDPSVQETGDALAARGLITTPGTRQRRLRVHGAAQAVVCGVLLVLSLPLTVVDFVLHEGDGVPFVAVVLPVLLAGIAVGSVAASRARRRITPAGAEALRAVRAHYGADQSPYVQTSLFGLRGLRDPYLREQLVPAARGTRLAAAQSRTRSGGSGSGAEVIPVLWCAGSDGGGGGGGSGCGSSGSGCGGGGGGCGGGGGGCGGGGGGGSSCSGSSGGSSCSSSSSGSSCSSSSSSSCGSSS